MPSGVIPLNVVMEGDEPLVEGDAWVVDGVPVWGPPTTVTPYYSVDLCDSFVRIGVATGFSFSAVLRHLTVGEWRLETTVAGVEVEAGRLTDVDSVVVRDINGLIVFAGLVRLVPGSASRWERHLTADATTLTISGVDLFGLLNTRLTFPTPTSSPPWADGHDERTGVASTVVAEYIAANIGSAALADRTIANLTVIDGALGVEGTWQTRLEPLGDLVARICREAEVTCRAYLSSSGAITYELGSASDHSSSIVFSDQGDLESVQRIITPAAATWVLTAGQGELTARTFGTADAGSSGLDRVELLYDNTQISIEASATRAALAQLALNGSQATVDAVLADTAAQQPRFGVDYRLGDLLGVEVDGVRYSSPVEQVRIEISPHRQRVTPLLGHSSLSEMGRQRAVLSAINQQLNTSVA